MTDLLDNALFLLAEHNPHTTCLYLSIYLSCAATSIFFQRLYMKPDVHISFSVSDVLWLPSSSSVILRYPVQCLFGKAAITSQCVSRSVPFSYSKLLCYWSAISSLYLDFYPAKACLHSFVDKNCSLSIVFHIRVPSYIGIQYFSSCCCYY